MPRKKKFTRSNFRDLVVFFCLISFPVAHFLLQDFPNTEFYLALLTFSLFGLLMVKQYHKDKQLPFDFDENLTAQKWLWIGGGTLAIFGVSAFFASVSTPAQQFDPTIFVPTFGYIVYFLGTYQFPVFINDMLFNLTLVAPAEELAKLVSTSAIFLMLTNYRFLDKNVKIAISVGVPCLFWSVLHVYKNPAYIGNVMFVVSAFISGLILYVVLWKTESILAAILCHALYNILVIFLIAQGILMVPT